MNLNDRTIDSVNAKYWCAFCDLKKNKLAESLLAESVMMHQTNTPASGGTWETIKSTLLTRPKNELQYIVKGLDQKTAEEVAQNTVDYLKTHGSNAASSIANELGEVHLSNDGTVDPASQLVKTAAGTTDMTGKDVSWWRRAIEVACGYAKNIVNWFSFGTTDINALNDMSQPEKLKALVTKGGLHALELMAIIYVLYKTRQYTFPRLQLAWKNMKSGKALAKCKFKNTDNESFEVFFDTKKHRWVLAKVNGFFGSLTTSANKLFVDEDGAREFFSTKFFERFVEQCKKYIEPYLDIDSKSDIAKSSIVKYVSANKSNIENYMFAGQYAMFENDDNMDN